MKVLENTPAVNEFFIQFSSFNLHDTFNLKLVFFTNFDSIKRQGGFETERIKVELIPLQCLCRVQMLKG